MAALANNRMGFIGLLQKLITLKYKIETNVNIIPPPTVERLPQRSGSISSAIASPQIPPAGEIGLEISLCRRSQR